MKILFICGSLEAGKDGVGDYTRLVSGMLKSKRHEVSAIAINDKHISEDVSEVQRSGDVDVKVFRISYLTETKAADNSITDIINTFNPEWISIQFVPFSFNDRGLIYGFGSRIKKLAGNVPVHIMFHELWGGINNDDSESIKEKILFALQKFFIFSAIKAIAPARITTTIAAYKNALPKHIVNVLPLFSNIPVSGSVNVSEENVFRIVTFGTLSSDMKGFTDQMKWLKEIALHNNKVPEYIHLGSGGRYKEESLNVARKILGQGKVLDAGLLSEEEVSAYLSISDAGLSRADGLLWGKSGTTMAMLEHGLPVVLKGERKLLSTYKNAVIDYIAQLYFYDDPKTDLIKRETINALPVIGNEMLKILSGKS